VVFIKQLAGWKSAGMLYKHTVALLPAASAAIGITQGTCYWRSGFLNQGWISTGEVALQKQLWGADDVTPAVDQLLHLDES
jgi:hypothetical protein